MKAIIREKYGNFSSLNIKEIDKPVLSANEVLVKVHCTTVNRTDTSIVTGKPFVFRFFIGLFRPKIPVTGTDFAGEVVGVGEAVTDFKVGERVFGFNDEGLGSHAEYLTIGADKAIARIPSGISYTQAAASAEGAHYALNTLNKVTVNKGDKVLVNGATGAIGSAAIQLLLLEGAEVTAVCDTKNVPVIQSMGVHRVVNYEQEDFTLLNEKFSLICDAVGKSRFSLCKKIMTPNAVYVSSELGPRAENVFLPLITRNKNKQRVIFPIPVDCRKSIKYMSTLLSQQKFMPLIDRIYPMKDIVEALTYVDSGMKTGNVILKIVE